jgi:hypothetical protein
MAPNTMTAGGTNDIPDRRIESVASYVEYIETHCSLETRHGEFALFRGQRMEYPAGLVPTIARYQPHPGSDKDLPSVERDLFVDFQKKSLPFLERVPDTTLDWLTVAQHHGVPTRLLDWSCNALTSLWFVIENGPDTGDDGIPQDGVIYMLTTHESDWTNWKRAPRGDELFEHTELLVYEPPSITRRVFAQSGYFTVHPYIEQESRYQALDTDPAYRKRLSKLTIPHGCFEHIRTTLDRLGINRFTIYQSLDVLGDHLKWYHLHDPVVRTGAARADAPPRRWRGAPDDRGDAPRSRSSSA